MSYKLYIEKSIEKYSVSDIPCILCACVCVFFTLLQSSDFGVHTEGFIETGIF